MDRESLLETVKPETGGWLWISGLSMALFAVALLGMLGVGAYIFMNNLHQPVLAQNAASTPPALVIFPSPLAEIGTVSLAAPVNSGDSMPMAASASAETGVPAIVCDPPDAKPGDIMTVSGAHWPPGDEIRLVLSGYPEGDKVLAIDGDRYAGSATVDQAGNFRTELRVPEGTTWDSEPRALVVAFSASHLLNAVYEVRVSDSPAAAKADGASEVEAAPSGQKGPVAILMVEGEASAIQVPSDGSVNEAGRVSYPQNGFSVFVPLVTALGAAALVAAATFWLIQSQSEGSEEHLDALDSRVGEINQRLNALNLEHLDEALLERLEMMDATLKETIRDINASKEMVAMKLEQFRREDIVQKVERLEMLEQRRQQFWDGLDIFMDGDEQRASVLKEFAAFLDRSTSDSTPENETVDQ